MKQSLKRACAAVAASVLIAGAAVGLDQLTASGAPATHTVKFVATTIKGHSLGKTTFANTEVERRHGKVIGFDSVSGKFNVHTQTAEIWVGVAWKGGTLNVIGTSDSSGNFKGRIVGGTGKYKGIKGIVTGTQVSKNKTALVAKYTL